MLICITGLAGSGKSEVAKKLVALLKLRGELVVHYSTDSIRHKLYPEVAVSDAEMGRDFTSDELKRVYNTLYFVAEEVLSVQDAHVVVEGTFRTLEQRQKLREIASRVESGFILVWIKADESVVLTRLEARLAEKKGAGPEAYLSAKAQYEEPTEAEDPIAIENNGSLESLSGPLSKVVEQLW